MDYDGIALEIFEKINGDLEITISDDSAWHYITNNAHQRFLNCLNKPNHKDLRDFLIRLHEQGVLRGIDQYSRATSRLKESHAVRAATSVTIYRSLLCLASALGLVPLYHPEQDYNHDFLNTDRGDELGGLILDSLVGNTGFPNIAKNKFGLVTHRGLIGLRDIISLGYLMELKQILERGTYRGICEIGAGLGRLCHFVPALPYVIIDLPQINLLQYFFLRALATRHVTLWDVGSEISILNCFTDLESLDLQDYLFVNCDSFVEMGRTTQLNYLRLVRRNGGTLLSINHEAGKVMTPNGDLQQIVSKNAGEAGLTRVSRAAFWPRAGYVTELYV